MKCIKFNLIFATHWTLVLAQSKITIWKFDKMGLKAREIIEEPKKIYFDPHETYVVLNIDRQSTISLYYMFGKDSNLNERLSTVDFVTDKLQEISNSFSDKITVIREVHNQESPIFKNIFPKVQKSVNSIQLLKLYKVEIQHDLSLHIQQIPANLNHLNVRTTFVLDTNVSIWVIKGKSATEIEKRISEEFGCFIQNNDYKRNKKIKIYDLEVATDFVSTLRRHSPGVSVIISEQETYNLEGEVKLTEYSYNNDSVNKKEIPRKSLKLTSFKEQNCYLLMDSMRSEIHVYIGESSNIEVIREVLKSGEILVVNNNSTYKLSIVQLNNLSTPFQVHFPEFSAKFIMNAARCSIL